MSIYTAVTQRCSIMKRVTLGKFLSSSADSGGGEEKDPLKQQLFQSRRSRKSLSLTVEKSKDDASSKDFSTDPLKLRSIKRRRFLSPAARIRSMMEDSEEGKK